MARYALRCAGLEHPADQDAVVGFVDLPEDHPGAAAAAHGYLCASCSDRYREALEVLEEEHQAALEEKVASLPPGLEHLEPVVVSLHGRAPLPELAEPAEPEPVHPAWVPDGFEPATEEEQEEAAPALEEPPDLERPAWLHPAIPVGAPILAPDPDWQPPAEEPAPDLERPDLERPEWLHPALEVDSPVLVPDPNWPPEEDPER